MNLPPFVREILDTLVRAVVVFFVGWVAAHGGPSFTTDQVTKITTEATPLVAVLAWSIWQKYHNRIKLLTALAAPQPMTEAHVDTVVAAGGTPPVNTPKYQIPANT